jgi:predicted nuclease of restriction endonuclease-like (RecB) superfamily
MVSAQFTWSHNIELMNKITSFEERKWYMEKIIKVTKLLLELGVGFTFIGDQDHLEVAGEDFYLDLLFYHLKLKYYVVIPVI